MGFFSLYAEYLTEQQAAVTAPGFSSILLVYVNQFIMNYASSRSVHSPVSSGSSHIDIMLVAENISWGCYP